MPEISSRGSSAGLSPARRAAAPWWSRILRLSGYFAVAFILGMVADYVAWAFGGSYVRP